MLGNFCLCCFLDSTQFLNAVTKPFGSTSGLSRPFKPPTFVNKADGLSNPVPPVMRPLPVTRPPAPKGILGVPVVPELRIKETSAEVEMEAGECMQYIF
jgi:hypothetical protein